MCIQDKGMEYCIEKRALLVMKPREWHDERNGTTNSMKNQNARRKGNLQIFRGIGNGHDQTSGDERKAFKKNTSGEREIYSKTNYIARTLLEG